jgi:hypothetical protein
MQQHFPAIFPDAVSAEHGSRSLILRAQSQVNPIAEQVEDLVLRQISILPLLEVVSELPAQLIHAALADTVHFQSVR